MWQHWFRPSQKLVYSMGWKWKLVYDIRCDKSEVETYFDLSQNEKLANCVHSKTDDENKINLNASKTLVRNQCKIGKKNRIL